MGGWHPCIQKASQKTPESNFRRGGGSQTPAWYVISNITPPPMGNSMKISILKRVWEGEGQGIGKKMANNHRVFCVFGCTPEEVCPKPSSVALNPWNAKSSKGLPTLLYTVS